MNALQKLLSITIVSMAATTAFAQQEAIEDYNQVYTNQMLSQHEDVIGLLDKDGDGMCSSQEFMSAHRSIFDSIDANSDGLLSEEEMGQFQANMKNG